ncbi:MAG TPA: RNA polymerase sigma factor [Polyangiaceae bacterium]
MSQAPVFSSPLTESVTGPWRRFLEEVEPLRPELYRYCRYLAQSPWDAEDLVQDALARAFVTLGCVSQTIENPRAWLFRVASNLWLNRVRRPRDLEEPDRAEAAFAEPRETREAAGTLIGTLAPQERAAVVLKDVFDLSLDEVAETLATTTGAVKAALHRGRGKLVELPVEQGHAPVPAVLDAFVTAFNARDLDRLTALLLDTASVEFPGLHVEYGAETARSRSLSGVLFGNPAGDRSGIPREHRGGLSPEPPRLELRSHRGEPLLLGWFSHDHGAAVRAITRVDIAGDRIARLRTYLHQPDVLREICAELDVSWRSNGYRFW